jgi:hypothetical protein
VSGKQKALLILLAVALVVLFVIAVGTSSGQDNGEPSKPNGFVEWLAKVGTKSAAVDPQTVSADCDKVDGQPNSYTFTGSCTLTVEDPGKMKMLILHSGKEFHVEAPGPGDSEVTFEGDVEPSPGTGAETKVAVDKRTEVEISCPGIGTTCVVTVAAE